MLLLAIIVNTFFLQVHPSPGCCGSTMMRMLRPLHTFNTQLPPQDVSTGVGWVS